MLPESDTPGDDVDPEDMTVASVLMISVFTSIHEFDPPASIGTMTHVLVSDPILVVTGSISDPERFSVTPDALDILPVSNIVHEAGDRLPVFMSIQVLLMPEDVISPILIDPVFVDPVYTLDHERVLQIYMIVPVLFVEPVDTTITHDWVRRFHDEVEVLPVRTIGRVHTSSTRDILSITSSL